MGISRQSAKFQKTIYFRRYRPQKGETGECNLISGDRQPFTPTFIVLQQIPAMLSTENHKLSPKVHKIRGKIAILAAFSRLDHQASGQQGTVPLADQGPFSVPEVLQNPLNPCGPQQFLPSAPPAPATLNHGF